MSPPPHPFRVLDFYRDPKTGGLGVAWNSMGNRRRIERVSHLDVPVCQIPSTKSLYIEA